MNRLFFHFREITIVVSALLIGGCGGAGKNAEVSKPKAQPEAQVQIAIEPESESPESESPESKGDVFAAVTEDGRFNLRTVDSAVRTQESFYAKQLAFAQDTVWMRDRLRHYSFTAESFEAGAPEPSPITLTEQYYWGRNTQFVPPAENDAGLYVPYYDSLTRIVHEKNDSTAASSGPPTMHRFKDKVLGLWSAPEKPVVAVTAAYFFRKGSLFGLHPKTLSMLWKIEDVIADAPIAYGDFIFAVQAVKDKPCMLLKINPQNGMITAKLPLVGTLHGPMRLAGNELLLLLEASMKPRSTRSLFYATVDLADFSAATYLDLKEKKNGHGDIYSSFIALSGSEKYRAAALPDGADKIILLGPDGKREIPLPEKPYTAYPGPGRLAQVGDTLFAAGRDRLYSADLNKEEVAGALVFKSVDSEGRDSSMKTKIEKIGALGAHVFVQTNRRLFHLKVAPNPRPEALTRLHHISSSDWPISNAEALADGDPDTRFDVSKKTSISMQFEQPVLISGVALRPAAKSKAKQNGERAALTLEWNTDERDKNASGQKPLPYAEVSDIHTFTARCSGNAPCSTAGSVQLLE
jgi:hypothetical protein